MKIIFNKQMKQLWLVASSLVILIAQLNLEFILALVKSIFQICTHLCLFYEDERNCIDRIFRSLFYNVKFV